MPVCVQLMVTESAACTAYRHALSPATCPGDPSVHATTLQGPAAAGPQAPAAGSSPDVARQGKGRGKASGGAKPAAATPASEADVSDAAIRCISHGCTAVLQLHSQLLRGASVLAL